MKALSVIEALAKLERESGSEDTRAAAVHLRAILAGCDWFASHGITIKATGDAATQKFHCELSRPAKNLKRREK